MARTKFSTNLDVVRTGWNAFAARYTATLNQRTSAQCAAQMHAHAQLETARRVLEVGAGAGVGSLDVLSYLHRGAQRDGAPREFIVTDFAPTMVELASETLKTATDPLVQVSVVEANGQDLVAVETRSIDRYLSSLTLQLCPDPDALLREARRVLTDDGLAAFTVWGRSERSGIYAIDAALDKELGIDDGSEHPNFAISKDLGALRERFQRAGFRQVMIWPFLCVAELWSGDAYAQFHGEVFYVEDEALRAQKHAVAKRLADEWLATGLPLGIETYIIVARP